MDVTEHNSFNAVANEDAEGLTKRGLEPCPARPAPDQRDTDSVGLRGDQVHASRMKTNASGGLVVEVHEAGDLDAITSRAVRGQSTVLSAGPHDRASNHSLGRTTGRPSCRLTARSGPKTSAMSSALKTVSAVPSRTIRPWSSTTSRVAMAEARFGAGGTAGTGSPLLHAQSQSRLGLGAWCAVTGRS